MIDQTANPAGERTVLNSRFRWIRIAVWLLAIIAIFTVLCFFVVPPLLRDSASIVGDVRVFGKIDYLEVWNEERFAQKLARDQWTDEDGLKLAEHGI